MKMSEKVEAAATAKQEVTDPPGAEGAVGLLRKDWLTRQRTSFRAEWLDSTCWLGRIL